MPSAGIRQLPSGSYRVYWRLDDGSQGGETFKTEDQAIAYRNKLRVQWEEGSWIDPRRGRISFDEWASQ